VSCPCLARLPSCPCLCRDFGPQCRPGRSTENGPTQRGSEVSYCWMNNSRWIKTLSIKTPLSHTAAPSDSSRATPSDSCTLAPIPPSAFYGLSSFGSDRRWRGTAAASLGRPVMRAAASPAAAGSFLEFSSQSLPSLSLPLILSAATAWPTACSSSPLRLSVSLLLSGAAVGELARHGEAPVVPCLGRDLGTAALCSTARQCRRAPPCSVVSCQCRPFGHV